VNKTTGNWNNFLGMETGANNNGYYNTFIGHISGQDNNGNNNTFVGAQSGSSSRGADNVFIGYSSGRDAAGGNNCFVGTYSGSYSATGSGNTLIGNGSARGVSAGSYTNNTFLGYETGRNITSGSGNVFLGYQAGYNEAGSNKLYIDNSDTSSPLIYGDFNLDALTVNGIFTTTGNASVNGTNLRMTSDPGSGTTPTNYVYQGGMVNSTSKPFAFTIYDALWVTSHTYIDGKLQIQGGTQIGKTQAGTQAAGLNSSGGVKSVTINFPSSFSTTPKINVTPVCEFAVDDIFTVTVKSITASSCVVNIYRIDSYGGAWGQNLQLNWYAWE